MQRIPSPTQEEIATLPSVAQNILSIFKDIPQKEYRQMARAFINVANGTGPTINNMKMLYLNPNIANLYSMVISEYGEYNPDRIPIKTYEKMALDPQIAIATAMIELPIIAQSYRIECEDESIALFVSSVYRNIYRKLLKSMLKSIRFGFAVGEKIYSQEKVKITKVDENGNKQIVYDDWAVIIKNVKFAHPSSVQIIRDDKTEDIKYVTQINSTLKTGETPIKIPIKKCVWFAPEAEYGDFFGSSRYKNSYQSWYWGAVLMQFMMKYLERRGSPSVKIKAPPGFSITAEGTKVDNMEIALKTGQSLISNSVAVIPTQFKDGKELWDAELIKDDQRGDMFVQAIQYLNTLKMRGLLVPDRVVMSDGSSSNATAESHTDVHFLAEEALIQKIEECMNEQIIPDLVKYNFPIGQQAPCYIKIERLNHSKRLLLRDIFTRMLMLSGGSMRDGRPPVWVPSLKKIADFLEVPGDEFDNIFLPIVEPGSKNKKDKTKKTNAPNNISEINNPLAKKQTIIDRNKNSKRSIIRTRRERVSRERLEEID
jgi:hypothetical protein